MKVHFMNITGTTFMSWIFLIYKTFSIIFIFLIHLFIYLSICLIIYPSIYLNVERLTHVTLRPVYTSSPALLLPSLDRWTRIRNGGGGRCLCHLCPFPVKSPPPTCLRKPRRELCRVPARGARSRSKGWGGGNKSLFV